MRAFSSICDNICISLMYDTLTIYPRFGPEGSPTSCSHFIHSKAAHFFHNQHVRVLRDGITQYGIVRFVFRNDRDHEIYHQDIQDRESLHYHMMFDQFIDEKKFNDLLNLLIQLDLLSKTEKLKLRVAFRQANIIHLDRETFSFTKNVFLLEQKAQQLQKKSKNNENYQDAAKSATFLYKNLKSAYSEYSQNKNQDTYITFKKACHEAIIAARPVLEKHRGYKQLVGNLVLAIALLGVGYVIAGFINRLCTGRFLFFKTDSAEYVDFLARDVERMRIG